MIPSDSESYWMTVPVLQTTYRRFRDCIFLLLVSWFAACPAWAGYPVSVTTAVRGHWRAHIRVLGEVRSLSHAILRAPVNGRLGDFAVPNGSRVRAGRTLGRVTPPGLAAHIAAAHSRLVLARQLLKHERALYGQRLVTHSAVQRATTRIAVDQDTLQGLEFEREQTQLIAPASGTVHYLAPPATQIAAGTPVIRIGGAGLVWVRTFVPPSAARLLHTGQIAVLQDGGEKRQSAELTAVGTSARHDGLVEVFLRPARMGLLPGEWLWVSLPATSGVAWQVPRAALVMQGSHARIYILHHHRAAALPVTLVHATKRYVWLRGQLHPGEQVIVHGAGMLTDHTPVSTVAPHSVPGA